MFLTIGPPADTVPVSTFVSGLTALAAGGPQLAAIVEWVKGTGLRPYLDHAGEDHRDAFLADYLGRVEKAYPKMSDGRVLLRFPLGHMAKSETRALAERFDLAVAAKPDSQDICFVPGGDYAAVVRKLRPEADQPGDIVDMSGKVVGRHDGIVRFTVGQRRGLALGERDGTDNDPLYVVRLEPEKRRVVVGPRSALGKSEIELYDVNWIGPIRLSASRAGPDKKT